VAECCGELAFHDRGHKKQSRLSRVTHYHPDTTTPFWFRHHPAHRHAVLAGDNASFASQHYILPARRGMLEPKSL